MLSMRMHGSQGEVCDQKKSQQLPITLAFNLLMRYLIYFPLLIIGPIQLSERYSYVTNVKGLIICKFKVAQKPTNLSLNADFSNLK